tara:strand:- start:998 stop:2257 length:1260 start_codon:yes stop_codon:yes gene_type:complete
MATIKSNYFLLNQDSFFTETSGDKAKVIRSGVGKKLSADEIQIAGDYYNKTENTIDYAEIYNLDFGPNFMTKLGASDEWMSKALTDKSYKDAFKKATDKTGPNVDFLTGANIAKKLWNPTPINQDPNGKSTRSKGVGSVLYYPLNRDRKNYDYLKVTACKYAPGSFGSATSLVTEVGDEGRELVPLGSVILPMQPGLSDSSSVGWGENQLNAVEAAAANIAGSTVKGAAQSGSKALAGFMGGSKDAIKELFGKEGAIDKGDVAAYFAGQAVSNPGVFTRGTGKVMNPNLELLFTGPALRSFAYSYKFTPREDAEARMVRKIIRFFKKHMAAKRSDSNIFLKSPDVFKLKYIFKGGGQHPYLNKIKTCALRSFDVQYTPDGSYMTYGDGSMTSYQVSLNFGELNPIYDKDYDGSENDMGY